MANAETERDVAEAIIDLKEGNVSNTVSNSKNDENCGSKQCEVNISVNIRSGK